MVRNKNNKNLSSDSSSAKKDYRELLQQAEKLRKNKKTNQAKKTYWRAIKTGEQNSDWQKNGPQAKPYKQLAKLYYHTKQDKQAIEVLNRYLQLAQKHNLQTQQIKKLKRRLQTGNFRRLVNKYS